MPVFQIGADSPFTLASLIDGHGSIIGDLEEGDNALADAIGAANVSAQSTNIAPIVAQATGPFREQRIILNALEDMVQIITDGSEIT